MSRLAVRVFLIAAIALVIVAGTFITVKALTSASSGDSAGMYVLGGGLSNPLLDRAGDATAPKLDSYHDPNRGGHDCDSEGDSSDL